MADTSNTLPTHHNPLDEAFKDFAPDPNSSAPIDAQRAVHLARQLQNRANELQTAQERRQQAELDRMIQHPSDKATLMQMTDQAFRSGVSGRVADQLIHILDVQGIPRFFSPIDRTLLKGFQSFGNYLPGVAIPLVKNKMHRETANVILPAEHDLLADHLSERRDEGVRMNVNYLGEALLGEAEAEQRLKMYLAALQQPEIEVISVKISTIFSQISALGRRHTIETLCDRMELLYRAAAKARYTRSDGTVVPKFVYLDMEEYRDLDLTVAAFIQTLDRKGLEHVQAGIALQAYIPDSFAAQQSITAWAMERVKRGGAPVTVRIVKGANMEMERVDASLHGWPQAPFNRKVETDANYKRMLRFGLQPGHAQAVNLGIASHNLFALSYGLTLAVSNHVLPHVQFEMLEGMANHQRRALFELAQSMLLYAPACKKEDFIHAIGYLIRRLDENTGEENFLRHAFKLQVDNDDWRELESTFLESFTMIESLPDSSRRIQNRNATGDKDSPSDVGFITANWHEFINEPDTDFSLPHNVAWAEQIVEMSLAKTGASAADLPLIIAGDTVAADRTIIEAVDPSRPGVVIGRFKQAAPEDIRAAVKCARDDANGWRSLSPDDRCGILFRVADEIASARADLIGIAMIEGGKTVGESDPEISEAIDFCRFYALSAKDWQTNFSQSGPGLNAAGRGTVAVISPWNFPIAIPCGGIAAALAAGNTVILKPASDTMLIAHELCQCFWRAGVSNQALQLLPGRGCDAGEHLVPGVDAVILTGGTETAQTILRDHPDTLLFAETGGKNATIVTALADRDQAINNVIHSAFGHSGQKCSATSLLILEEEVYNDENFKRTMCDAVESFHVGPAHELHTTVGPLIRPPSGDLETALKELEDGETWAVLPRDDDNNPNLWSPGVKYGVTPQSYTHRTEFFGPVLGVMKAKNLDDALHLANTTGFGLTSGLESLDDREQEHWRDSIRAGNLYINRGTTGAIVLRQPFGGMGKSAFGPGIKAGGPNYVAQFMTFEESLQGSETINSEVDNEFVRELLGQILGLDDNHNVINGDIQQDLASAVYSYAQHYRDEFSREHDHFQLVGQDNLRRYLPVRELRVRVHENDSPFELFARVLAAQTVGCRVTVSFSSLAHGPAITLLDELTESWAGAIEFVEESDEQLVQVIAEQETDRIRYACRERVPTAVRQAATTATIPVYIADEPVRGHGRVELLWYVQEQSLCVNYHRYGNLGSRGEEQRAEVL